MKFECSAQELLAGLINATRALSPASRHANS